jgi:hypothetical protein
MSNNTTRLTTQAGVKRDGTRLDSNYFAEAIWCRFALGRPKKIGGYRKIAEFTAPIKAVHVYGKQQQDVLTVFSSSKIQAVLVDVNGNGSSVYERTPTSFVPYDDYSWTVDTAYDMTGSGQTAIYAHAGHNWDYIDSEVPMPVFYGSADGTTPLTPIIITDESRPATTGGISSGTNSLALASATGYAIGRLIRVVGAGVGGKDLYTDITNLVGTTATLRDFASTTVAGAVVSQIVGCDGGIVTVGPYLFRYGSNGLIANGDINNPSLVATGDANEANPVGTKVVKGLPVRGGGQSPSALFWSLDSVVKVSFVGGTLLFQYDIVTSQSSVLSGASIIEYDGTYYWLGIDRALMLAGGQVREIPNAFNNQWFFDNLNWEYREKVWASKVPRYGEIWWFFPKGDSTICNHAIVYNVRENYWFDTPIERSAGYYAQTFKNPVWGTEEGSLWQHEFNWDKIDGGVVTAIPSSFTSHDIGFPTGGATQEAPQGANNWTRLERIEPDFEQVGDMSVTIFSKEFAYSPSVALGPFVFNENTTKIDMRSQSRILNIKFENNSQGGTYWMGVPLLHLDTGDRRE